MRTVDQIKQAEHDRLASIEDRHGVEAMLDFARQTFKVYRACRKFNKNGKRPAYGKAYREELIVSCVVFKQVLRNVH